MGVLASLRSLVDRPPAKAWGAEFVRAQLSVADDAVADWLSTRFATATTRAWTRPSVAEALGVPSIHRAVTLISSTTGMLSIQGYRNGEIMDGLDGRPLPPRLITRPDPYHTPRAFYASTAASMAKYGEFVWWIAARDTDNLAAALVVVPLNELQVEENPDNRLFPRYRWGDKKGTRYSAANPEGLFVHELYPLGEPFALRGEGPLQMCGAATSVTVEAQAWAANFYGDGGYPREVIKKAGVLDPTLRDPVTLEPDPVNGQSEADLLRAQWVGRPNNVPRVIDETIDSISVPVTPNPQGAQMLQARQFQNGDAAREFAIPGSLLEYQEPGSSLTYQNLEGEFTKLVRTCLQPLYLEPIEQALSDLLPRSTTARFNVKGFLRADVKTRFEVHGMAIDKGIYGPDYAQREEGILPGDVEYAPVPFAPPAAVPTSVPRAASRELRDVRCPGCTRRLGQVEGEAAVRIPCRHCKTLVAA